MTYFSLGVRQVDAGDDGAEPVDPANLQHDKPRASRDWGPYTVASWAEKRGIKVEWVDSAWVQVRVSGPQLADFLQAAGGGTRSRSRLLTTSALYEISSEEF